MTPVTTTEAPAASPAIDFTEPHSTVMPSSEEYRKTGVLPSKEDRARTERPADEPDNQSENQDDSASSESETAAASEAAPGAEDQHAPKGPERSKNSSTSEKRWQKRERELKELRAENARLKSQGPQQRSEPAQVSQPAAQAEPQPAAGAEKEPTIDEIDSKTGKPKFATFQDFMKAHAKWTREETLREVDARSSRRQQETEQQRAERELATTFTKKIEPTRAKYQDFDKVALDPDLIIPKGSVVDMFLIDSDHAGEVLYYLGQHPDVLASFFNTQHVLANGKACCFDPKTGKSSWSNKITPQRQFRKLMEIEAQLSSSTRRRAAAAAAAAGEEGDEGDEGEGDDQGNSGQRSTARPISQAPRPPHQTSGKGSVGKDPVVEAVETGDSERYMNEVNRVALARRKKR